MLHPPTAQEHYALPILSYTVTSRESIAYLLPRKIQFKLIYEPKIFKGRQFSTFLLTLCGYI
jgi:hypothetical protein